MGLGSTFAGLARALGAELNRRMRSHGGINGKWMIKLSATPAGELLPRVGAYLRRQLTHPVRHACDRIRSTYLSYVPPGPLFSYLHAPDVVLLTDRFDAIAGVADCFLRHCFDYLGSGWVRVRFGAECRGLAGYRYPKGKCVHPDGAGTWLAGRVNRSNLREAQRLWSLVDADYDPIDWQLDFKSGYRWAEGAWAQAVRFGHLPGVDIKVPWELARMQHLPQLAIAFACARVAAGARFRKPDVYAREFRNQTLDFLATNPPRFGVNWRSAMDAGIRVANILIAYDLFRATGARFDEPFEGALRRSMVEHGQFIVEQFGFDHRPRSNHYLAHLVGLLFISAYLPRTLVADAWLAFAVQELLSETARQFNQDGSNFEGSTSYHRLSGEMVVYATALLAGLPGEKLAALHDYDHQLITVLPGLRPAPLRLDGLPSWLGERLERLAEFTIDITKPSGAVTQIGDNDSGRFLRLAPAYERLSIRHARDRYAHLEERADNHFLTDDPDSWWDESILDHRHLVAAVAGLVDRPDFVAFGASPFETSVVSGLARGARFRSYRATEGIGAEAKRFGEGRQPPSSPLGIRYQLRLEYPGDDLRHGLRLLAYADFGIYIFRSQRLFLSVRCGSLGQGGSGGHAHNDQLALELEIDGSTVFSDPGSYLYTALPAERNRYRSDSAHAGFRSVRRESASLDAGLFALRGDPHGRCLYFAGTCFVGQHTGYGFPVMRRVEVQANTIRVLDLVVAAGTEERALSVMPFYAAPATTVLLSPGYGKLASVSPCVDARALRKRTEVI